MELELIKEANLTLSKCGRPVMPNGLVALGKGTAYLMQFYFPASPAQASQTIVKEITPPSKAKNMPALWALRSIQATEPASLTLQVQLPDGSFLFNFPVAVDQIAGFGSNRFLFTEEKDCPIGSKLQVTLNSTDTTQQQYVALLFEGCFKYFLKNAPRHNVMPGIGCSDRYQAGPNQNILAPPWMWGRYPDPVIGCFDVEDYTYASDIQTMGQNSFATATIQIDTRNDFAARRRFFQIILSDSVTAATVQVRCRNGSGYAIDDDFLTTSYIANSPMLHDWDLAAGEQVFFDLQVVDFSGSGTLTVQCFLEGVKRGKK